MDAKHFDIIIVGAGAAGLMAAWELVQVGKKVAVVEAKEYVGGRAHTIYDSHFALPVETGAEFIHGNLKLTLDLLKKASGDYYKVDGEIWQKQGGAFEEQKDFIEDYKDLTKKFDSLKEDISIADFIQQYLMDDKYAALRQSLRNYVEGYYAANIDKASTLALKEEWQTSDDEQYRIEGGYIKLISFLTDKCQEKGCTFFLGTLVKEIHWKENEVQLITSGQTFTANKIIVTVSLGVLQADSISFHPVINEKINAAKQLGFGPVIKIALQFANEFWKHKNQATHKHLNDLSFIFSQKIVPTWWTQFPKNAATLTGWLGGPHAAKLKDFSSEEILQKSLSALSEIFNIDTNQLEQLLVAHHVFNWAIDPLYCGGYAYETVNAEMYRSVLKQPLHQTLYFAGEALHGGPEIGTVEAALRSGQETAQNLIAAI